MTTLRNNGKYAIVWCTNGGDYNYWRFSLASIRMMAPENTDLFVLADPADDLHFLDYIYGIRRIDPWPFMDELGFTKEEYDKIGNRWPVAILYKLCVPLIGEFKAYKAVMTLDTDVMAMPTPKLHTVEALLNHPLGEFEIGGVPDLYEPYDRTTTIIRELVPDDIRNEMYDRVWSKYGFGCQSYISAGLFLWNIPVIDRDIDWYIRRCRAFWTMIGRYRYPEQDFANGFMGVDCRIQTAFGVRANGRGPYIAGDACMRHFTGVGKHLMYTMASKIPEITPESRFSQARLDPRATDIRPSEKGDSARKCIVWTSNSDDDDVKKLRYSIDAIHEVCGDALSGIDLFVITDGPRLGEKFNRDGVRILDLSNIYDTTGMHWSSSGWMNGSIWWDRTNAARVLIPFIPELQDYDLALHLDGDMLVTDARMLDIFKENVDGYDCAMSAEFYVRDGIYMPHRRVRFCTAFAQSMHDIKDGDAILGRLRHGIYFSGSVFLANMAEMRNTFGSLHHLVRLFGDCIGNGAGQAEHDFYNGLCWIKRVSGAYNTAGTTHFLGEPTYCVHNYTVLPPDEPYPKPNTSQYI